MTNSRLTGARKAREGCVKGADGAAGCSASVPRDLSVTDVRRRSGSQGSVCDGLFAPLAVGPGDTWPGRVLLCLVATFHIAVRSSSIWRKEIHPARAEKCAEASARCQRAWKGG